MAQIGKVSAVFSASTSGLTSGVKSASSAFASLRSDIAGLRGGMSALVTINAAQFFGQLANAATQSIRSLVSMGQAQAEVIDQTSKLAARLGMTYAEMSGLALAGELAGVSMDKIGAAATKADVAFVRAANGSQSAVEAFSAIGLSVDQLNGLSAAGRFDQIAEAIAALPTEAERAAAAIGIFGRAGAELLPLFSQGAGAIAEARAEAERFGLALTNEQGQNVEAMNDAFTRAQQAVQGVVQQVVAYLAPAVTSVTEAFSNLIGSVGGANIGQAIGDALLAGAEYLAGVADSFIANLTPLWEYVSRVGGQWNAVFGIGQRVADFFSGVGRFWEGVFNGVASVISGVVGGLLESAAALAENIPGFGQTAAELQAASESFRQRQEELWANAGNAMVASAENFSNAAFGRPVDDAGEALAGPLVRTIREAREAANAAAAGIDVASTQTVEVVQRLDAGSVGNTVRQAVQGIESTSAEGVREMFRIMRGEPGDDVQQQQLGVLEQIRDGIGNLDGGGPEMELVGL